MRKINDNISTYIKLGYTLILVVDLSSNWFQIVEKFI